MDHIVNTLGHQITLRGAIKQDSLVEVSIANMAEHTAKQAQTFKIMLRYFYLVGKPIESTSQRRTYQQDLEVGIRVQPHQ